MTKQFQPGLGSGALREALRQATETLRVYTAMIPDQRIELEIKQYDALLSLSSPIEPGQPLNQRAWDLIRHQRMELHAAGLVTDEEYAALARDHDAVYRLENYDKVAQASSEIREALELMVKEWHWYAGKHGLGPARLQYALGVAERALSPSRQGAGGK